MVKRILLLGYGNVGKAFIGLLKDNGGDLKEKYSVDFVATKRGVSKNLMNPHSSIEYSGDLVDFLGRAGVDIVVDASSANYTNGEPSLSVYREILSRDGAVITANKAPLALAYKQIIGYGGRIGFQATVMSGTPSINLLRIIRRSRIMKLRGILNGTTNYILTLMYSGTPFDVALSEAKRLGYAEEDPSFDIDGVDAGAKLTILSNFGFNSGISLKDVHTMGIRNIKRATDGSHKVKLIAESDGLNSSVKPVMITPEDPLFYVDGVTNALIVETDIQKIMIQGPGAGPSNAAFGLLSDLDLLDRGLI